jgi:hypothetical protein
MPETAKFASVLVCSLGMLFSAVAADSQVNFNSLQGAGNPNSPTGVIRDPAGRPLAGSTFSAQLWGGLNSNPATFALISDIYSFADVGLAAPTFHGQIVDKPYPVPGSVGGDTFFYVVRAWNNMNGSLGNFAQAQQIGLANQSAVTSLVLLAYNDLPPDTSNFPSFYLFVPEPSEWSLVLLGGFLVFGIAFSKRNLKASSALGKGKVSMPDREDAGLQ